MPEKNQFSKLYENKIILAPMVRANSLPFRLTCLRLGADIVYSEEVIDHALDICERIENKRLNTIDYVNKTGRVMFRTCPEERNNLVIQLGSNSSARALRTAQLVSQDVMGVDFNFGCPKSFSLKGGMGAAMLNKPDEIKSLLTTCVNNLNIPVTCKIRILPDLNKTLELVKMIESCGVAAIAVHGRTKDQRPNDECDLSFIKEIANKLTIPVIANGGSNHIKTHKDILEFREKTQTSSVMIARAAMKNPSIFKPDNCLMPVQAIMPEFLKLAIRYDNYISYTKYTINAMLSPSTYGSKFANDFQQCDNYEKMSEMFDIKDYYDNHKGSISQVTRRKKNNTLIMYDGELYMVH